MIIAAAPIVHADGVGVVAAEVGCGYVGGFGGAFAGIAVGNLVVPRTDRHPGGGLAGFFLAYPAGVGFGVWGAGELWGEDSDHDWATAAAAIGSSYTTCFVGLAAGGLKGIIIGMLVAPATSAAAYNAVKHFTAADEEPAHCYISASFYF